MRILAISIRHVVLELTLVYVTFSMPECALTFRFVEVPLTFVVRSISPVLNAIAMSEFLNIRIIVHGAVTVTLARSVASIITIGDFHLCRLVPFLHLSSIY